MILHDIFEQREPYQQAIDKLEQHRIDTLNDRMQDLLARARDADPQLKSSLKKQFEKIKSERDSYYQVREAEKGQDVVDREAKIKALTPAKPGVAGAVKDVAQGLKKFLQSRPETGPTYEAQKKNSETVDEHGGGIGPRQHWQSLMREQGRLPMDTLNYYFPDINAQSDVEAIRAAIREIVNNPELSKTSKQRLLGQVGMMVQRNRALIGREWRQYLDRFSESDEQLLEGIKDTAGATAVIACLLAGGTLSGCATAPQQTTAAEVIRTGQDLGRTVKMAQRITKAGTEAAAEQELRNIIRGMGNRPEELNHSNILRIWRKIKGTPPVPAEPEAPEQGPAEPRRRLPQNEAREINSKDDFIKERDRLMRMITMETDPSNKQILRSAIRQLEGRAENEGWISLQQRMIREDTASGAAEQAILKRIMVAHTDLLKQFGPEKVMQAAEEVAYNVGDLGEIGSSDVSGWVKQVQQILGATA